MPVDFPEGFSYQPGLLSAAEEQTLIQHIRTIDFGVVKMRGVIARRRVAHFGWLYNYESWQIDPGAALPEFLSDVRERAAALLQVEAPQLAQVLVTEYPAGAGIGWHRDAPPFGAVVAVSLLSPCRLRLRYGSSGRAGATLDVEPRSAYVLSGASRSSWQHRILPTKAPRYSVTFRTLRSVQATKKLLS
jgi:alkylated DNA repair protein (DNA oxidative demethylase)